MVGRTKAVYHFAEPQNMPTSYYLVILPGLVVHRDLHTLRTDTSEVVQAQADGWVART